MRSTIRRAEADEVPPLAILLASSLADDPIMRWTMAADDREARAAGFFETFDRHTAARGWLWTFDDGAGVALWVPPGTEAEFEELTFALDGDRDEHGLALADADGMPAFLCTGREDNVAFYERRGFELVETGEAPDGGPRVWFLGREPGGRAK